VVCAPVFVPDFKVESEGKKASDDMWGSRYGGDSMGVVEQG